MDGMDWSRQQVEAIAQVERWLGRGGGEVFRLFGYAGTGKTTLLKYFAKRCDARVAAFTGKAAQVLRTKGVADASTIHSLIYIPVDKTELRAERDKLKRKKMLTPAEERRLRKLQEELRGPSFVLNRVGLRLNPPDLIMLDECSMIDKQMARDLLSFELPLLVVGDPAQLPPINGEGYFTNGEEPDVMLTEIHRQARGSPIIRMATRARQGEPVRGRWGNCGVSASLPPDWWREWQLLCGRNITRHNYNRRGRALFGFDDELPVAGDRLVCLRNNHALGLLNGSLWRVTEASYGRRNVPYFSLQLVSLDDGEREVECHAHKKIFQEVDAYEDWDWQDRLQAEEFDYGYALTVHKAQGSQWDRVVLVDESWCFREHRDRWLYTGLTRACEQLTLIRS
jgi:exodeoxyribonuclease-5